MYIAFEGVKGVGKTTIITHLQQMLASSLPNKTIEVLSPTRPMPSNHPIELQYDDSEDNDELREQLYAHRSNYHASLTNWQADMIIGDRSIITSLAVRWHRVSQEFSPLEHFAYVRKYESVINFPDKVIQLDCDATQLLQRYSLRQRSYGLYEECLEQLVRLKSHYQAVSEWLITSEAQQALGKKIDWIVIDSSQTSYLKTLEQVFNIVQMSR